MKKIPIYTIDSGVPLPPERMGVLRVYPIDKLEVGESILFPREDRAKVQIGASQLKKRSGKTFTVRVMDDKNVRIWRTS